MESLENEEFRKISDSEDSDVEMDEIDQVIENESRKHLITSLESKSIVTPGELITDDATWMRGHGTFYLDNLTFSSVAGRISQVNKLLSVEPFKGRYQPETGDHVIGRIIGTSNKRWKVEIGAEHGGVLMLGAVNLPGGALRRKSDHDELQMRAILKEGDLLNCEVQSLFNDGGASLHTRSLKYGKLRNGVFVKVGAGLVVRRKDHMHDLPGGVSVILGVNGFCWVYKTKNIKKESNGGSMEGKLASASANGYSVGKGSVSITRLEEESSWDIYSDKNDEISESIRESISRYRNCLMAMSYCNISITFTRLVKCYEISLGWDVNDLVSEEIIKQIGDELINSEKMRG